MNYNSETFWLIVFVGLTSVALFGQFIVMLMAYFMVRKNVNTVRDEVSEIRSTVMPMLNRSKELLEKVAPKVESVAADVADMAQSAREQTAHIRFTADEVLARVYRQTSRVDNMITNVADGMEHAGNVVADSVTKPVRQVSAILAAAKAFLGVLATGRRPDRQAEVIADQDMFV
jgi:methyl-accepting chemotaxis protein